MQERVVNVDIRPTFEEATEEEKKIVFDLLNQNVIHIIAGHVVCSSYVWKKDSFRLKPVEAFGFIKAEASPFGDISILPESKSYSLTGRWALGLPGRCKSRGI